MVPETRIGIEDYIFMSKVGSMQENTIVFEGLFFFFLKSSGKHVELQKDGTGQSEILP